MYLARIRNQWSCPGSHSAGDLLECGDVFISMGDGSNDMKLWFTHNKAAWTWSISVWKYIPVYYVFIHVILLYPYLDGSHWYNKEFEFVLNKI